MSTNTNNATVVAQRAVDAVHEMAHLTRPAITHLEAGDLYDLAATLTDLVAALPQILTQLSRYTAAGHAATCLAHASRVATDLAVVLDTTHQTLDQTLENIRNQP
jgi:hypothetical protein